MSGSVRSGQKEKLKGVFYMHIEEITHYSNCLDREMHMMIYGHGGVPFLAFPTQDSLCHNYEEFGMIRELSDYLENGQIQYFVVDTIDKESWSEGDWDKGRRAWKQELYFHYIVDEVMPFILERTGGKLPMTTGCSLGANHAVLTFLRRPDLFSGCVALSGLYDNVSGSPLYRPLQPETDHHLRRSGRLGGGRHSFSSLSGKCIPREGHQRLVRLLGL